MVHLRHVLKFDTHYSHHFLLHFLDLVMNAIFVPLNLLRDVIKDAIDENIADKVCIAHIMSRIGRLSICPTLTMMKIARDIT